MLGKKTNLKVIFEKGISSERNLTWKHYKFNNFLGIVLRGISTSPDSAFSLSVIPYLLKKYDLIFISNPTTPTGILAILFLKLLKIRYIIFSEGAYLSKNRNIKELIKQFVLSNAWYYFSGNPSNDLYFLKYNKHAKIVRFPFSSVFEKDVITLKQKYSLKDIYRKKLGYSYYNKIAIMVGRFIPLKQFDLVIKSWINITLNNLLIVIGEGPELLSYQKIIKEYNILNVKILPFQSKLNLDKYYILSDFLIHPSSYDVWGLIINEAFAKATPVFTSKRTLATEVMLTNNKNGFVIDFKNDDFIDEINKVLYYNSNIMKNYSINCLKTAKKFTLESMVNKVYKFISTN
jgi:glycosyltransferase involved in cell wall biosynthesis